MSMEIRIKSIEEIAVAAKEFVAAMGERKVFAFYGKMGAGKTTFIKMLLGLEKPDNGRFDIGQTVSFGYFSQEGMAFDDQQKVIDVVRDIADYTVVSGLMKDRFADMPLLIVHAPVCRPGWLIEMECMGVKKLKN